MGVRAGLNGRWIAGLVVAAMLAGPAGAGTLTYTYDEFGRLATATYPDGKVVTYTYDDAGNRTEYQAGTPASPLSVTPSATTWSYWKQGRGHIEADFEVVLTATGGVAPYTYSWEYVNGDTDLLGGGTWYVPISLGNGYWSGHWRGKVTDAASNVAYTSNVFVEFERVP